MLRMVQWILNTSLKNVLRQLELSGGWGGGAGVVGTLGISFNNFSARNIAKKGTWVTAPYWRRTKTEYPLSIEW